MALPQVFDRLRARLESDADRIATARVIAAALIAKTRPLPMTSKVQSVPLTLNRVVSSLNEAAEKAIARLEKAAGDQDQAIKQVHAVADVIEQVTKQTTDMLADMTKTNGPAADEQKG
jgi:hypothetical protein